MRIDVMIEGQEGVSWPQWLALAEACEAHGIPALWRSDHYLPLDGGEERDVLDAWGTVCALAARTTRLELGTLVSPATFRHPAVVAKLAATADQISGGRVTLGLGAGWHDGEHETFGLPFPPLKARMDGFAAQLEAVRRFWGPDHPARPKPRRPRLIVGGEARPRGLRLGAAFADEYNTVYATPEQCRERRAAWDAACGSERKPFSVMLGAVIGRDDAEVERRRRVLGEPRPSWLHGTPDAVRAQLAALEDAGVDRVMVQLLLHDELDQVELLAGLAG